MDIIIIGTGNVATVIGRKILAANHRIVQVYSRNPAHAANLALALNAKPLRLLRELPASADLILLAISDNAYESLVQEMPVTHSLVVHTAGAIRMDVLKSTGARYGVLYPLQRLRREMDTIPEFPLLIDANEPRALQELRAFAGELTRTVVHANDETRLKYHLAAVLAGNFTNHLLALTENWCQRESIDFSTLRPLVEETVLRLKQVSPSQMQTGPAIRHDTETLEKHRQLLKPHPQLQQLYDEFTRSIQQFYSIK